MSGNPFAPATRLNSPGRLSLGRERRIAVRAALLEQLGRLHERLLATAREDPACRLLMSAPGVGAVVALTFRAAVNDRMRFAS